MNHELENLVDHETIVRFCCNGLVMCKEFKMLGCQMLLVCGCTSGSDREVEEET